MKIFKSETYQTKEYFEQTVATYQKEMETYFKPTFGMSKPTASKEIVDAIEIGLENIEWVEKTEQEFLEEENNPKTIDVLRKCGSIEGAKELKKIWLIPERNQKLDQLRFDFEDGDLGVDYEGYKKARKTIKDFDKKPMWNLLKTIEEIDAIKIDDFLN